MTIHVTSPYPIVPLVADLCFPGIFMTGISPGFEMCGGRLRVGHRRGSEVLPEAEKSRRGRWRS